MARRLLELTLVVRSAALCRVAVWLVCLVASGCASSRAAQPAATGPAASDAEAVRFRVVPQVDVANRRFVIPEGQRFVVFPTGAVDVPNGKVAWVRSFSFWQAQAPADSVAIDSASQSGLQLFDLRTGAGPEFPGARIEHTDIDARWVALQRAREVAIIDTVEARQVLSLPASAAASSVVLADGALHVLIEQGTSRGAEVRQFEVVSFSARSGEVISSRRIEVAYSTLVPETDPQYRSSPYLTRSSDAGLCLTLVAGCPACPEAERTPLRLYRHPLDPASKWRTDIVEASDAARSKLVRPDYLPTAFGELPEPARQALAKLDMADLAFVDTVAPRNSRFVTTNALRACEWSVARVERVGCRPTSAGAPPPAESSACQVEVAAPDAGNALPSGAVPFTRGGRLVAVAYDLSDTQWVVTLPSGHFSGSSDAPRFLAFYRPDGTLLAADAAAALRISQDDMTSRLAASLGCSPLDR